jgi:hypothetical protein
VWPSAPPLPLGVVIALDPFVQKSSIESRGQLARGVEAARAKKLVPRRDLDEDGQASPRGDGHADEWDPHANQLVDMVVEAEPIVLLCRIPSFQLDDQLHAFR